MAETAVATTDQKDVAKASPLDTLRAELEKQKPAIAQILPRTLTPERMVKLMIVSASREPKLLECTLPSILMAFMRAVELGLEVNSPLGHAYIIPYYNGKTKRMEAQFQLGYRGLLALIRRSDEVADVNAYCVRKNDKFEIHLGDHPHISHTPTVEGDPGEIIGAYMIAKLKGGGAEREWMTVAEIDAVRERSQAVQAGRKFSFKTPWDTDYGEMARKTVLKRGGKRLPISTEVAEIIEQDNRSEFGALAAASFSLPPMPREVGAPEEGAGTEPPAQSEHDGQQETGEEPERTIEDEIRELGEVLGKKPIEVNALIRQHTKAGTLDSIRDQLRLDYKRQQGGGQ